MKGKRKERIIAGVLAFMMVVSSVFVDVPATVWAAEAGTEKETEQPKQEEPKKEEPKAEEPKKEEPKAEEPKKEEPKAEEPKQEEPKAKAAKAEEPKQEEPKTEEPKQEEPKAEEPKQEEPKAEEPKQEEPKAEEPKQEEPKAEEPKQEEPKAEEPKQEEPKAEKPKQEEPKQEEPKTETPKTEEPKAEEPEKEKPKKQAAKIEGTNIQSGAGNDGTMGIDADGEGEPGAGGDGGGDATAASLDVKLDKSTVELYLGNTTLEKTEFSLTVTKGETTLESGYEVSSESSDSEVVTADGRQITAVRAGTAVVTVTVTEKESGLTGTATINVTVHAKPEIEVDPSDILLTMGGGTKTLNITVKQDGKPTDEEYEVTCTGDDKVTAEAVSQGKYRISARQAGSGTLTIKAENKAKKISVEKTVVVEVLPEPQVKISQPQVLTEGGTEKPVSVEIIQGETSLKLDKYTLSYKIADTNIAELIENNGAQNIRPKTVGKTIVTVTAVSREDEALKIVGQADIEVLGKPQVTLDPDPMTLDVGSKLVVTQKDIDGKDIPVDLEKCKIELQENEAATFDEGSGTITPKKAGEVELRIKVTYDGVEVEQSVNTTVNYAESSGVAISVQEGRYIAKYDQTCIVYKNEENTAITFKATVSPKNADQAVRWSSSNADVASTDSPDNASVEGSFSLNQSGVTTITAETADKETDKKKKVELTLVVLQKEDFAVEIVGPKNESVLTIPYLDESESQNLLTAKLKLKTDSLKSYEDQVKKAVKDQKPTWKVLYKNIKEVSAGSAEAGEDHFSQIITPQSGGLLTIQASFEINETKVTNGKENAVSSDVMSESEVTVTDNKKPDLELKGIAEYSNPDSEVPFTKFIANPDNLSITVKANDQAKVYSEACGLGLNTVEYSFCKVAEDVTLDKLESNSITWRKLGGLTAEVNKAVSVPSEEGYYILAVKAEDMSEAGNESKVFSEGIVIDRTAPRITIQLPAESQVNGFYTADVIPVITVEDNDADAASGVKEIRVSCIDAAKSTVVAEATYQIPGSEQVSLSIADMKKFKMQIEDYVAKTAVDKAGVFANKLQFKVAAEDVAGNKSDETKEFKLDAVVPEITVKADSKGFAPTDDIQKNGIARSYQGSASYTFEFQERNFEKAEIALTVNDKAVKIDTENLNALTKYGIRAALTDSAATMEEKDYPFNRTNTLTLTFSQDGEYVIQSVKCTDRAGHESGKQDAGVHEYAHFTVDSAAPVVTFDPAIGNNNKEGILTYSHLLKSGTKEISFTATDALDGIKNRSGIKELTYGIYYTAAGGGDVKAEQLPDIVKKLEDPKVKNNQVEFTGNTLNVPVDGKDGYYLVVVRAEDQCGNAAYYASNGLVYDAAAPVIRIDMPELPKLSNGSTNAFYTDSVTPVITVTDAAAGIDTITVSCIDSSDGASEREAVAKQTFDIAGGKKANLTLADMKSFYKKVIDNYTAAKGLDKDGISANNLRFRVDAVDIAGNKAETAFSDVFRIDAKAPVITVTDQSESGFAPTADNQKEGIARSYTDSAVFEFTFTERNFDSAEIALTIISPSGEKTEKTITASKPNALSSYGITGTRTDSEQDANQKEYTAGRTNTVTLTFAEEGEYIIQSVKCKDQAGHESAKKDAEVHSYAHFTVDRTAPVVTFDKKAGNNKANGTLTYAHMNQEKQEVSFTAVDADGITNRSGIKRVRYGIFKADKDVTAADLKTISEQLAAPTDTAVGSNTCSKSLTVPKDTKEGHYLVVVEVEDQNGNKAYYASNGLVYDVTPPAIYDIAFAGKAVNDIFTNEVKASYQVDAGTSGEDKLTGLKRVWVSTIVDGKETVIKPDKYYAAKLQNLTIAEMNAAFERALEHKFAYKDFDSNNIQLKVMAEDMAGNRAEKTSANIMVDVTSPKITAKITGKQQGHTASSGADSYKGKVTATVEFTERNFIPKDAVVSLTISTETGNVNAELNAGDLNALKQYGITAVLSDSEKGKSKRLYTKDRKNTLTLTFDQQRQYRINSVRCTDEAGHKKTVTDIKKNQFVIDRQKPQGKLTVTTKNPGYTIYKSNVSITVDMEDPIVNGSNSCLESVIYEVYNGSKKTQEGELVRNVKNGAYPQSISEKIVVNAKKNDSNDVTVKVIARDRTGNSATLIKKLAIDVTKPALTVTYNQNSPKNGRYYNVVRTATVTVRERNFDAGAVKWKITNTDGRMPVISKWSHGKANGNATVHTCTITYSADGDYTFTFELTDKAGNNRKFDRTDDFTIDRTAPVVTVNYTNKGQNVQVGTSTANQIYKQGSIQMSVNIKEHNFRAGQDIVWTSNGSSVNAGFSSSGDTRTASTTFSADNHYVTGFAYTDLAGNAANVISDGYFTVDNTAPTNGEVKIDGVGNWNKFTGFDHPRKDASLHAVITGQDALSGPPEISWYKSSSQMSEGQLAGAGWHAGSTTTISTEEQFILYARLEDKAGNISYVSSDGVILDRSIEKPEITITTPKPAQDIYDGDVQVNIKVTDPERNASYSGIKTVRYEVYNGATRTQSGEFNGAKHEQTLNNNITVKSALNNSNDVTIKAYVTDQAGNTATEEKTLAIDTTQPEISVSYDLTASKNEVYYNAVRTATVTVRERNFDENGINLQINQMDGVTVSGWSHSAGQGVSDSTTHTCTIAFANDNDYTFTMSAADMAGNKSSYDQTDAFTIDRTKPVVTIDYSNVEAENGNYYNADIRATVTVVEHNFSAGGIKVTNDADAGTFGDLAWNTSGDTHTAVVNLSEDGYYSFVITSEDLAGNAGEEFSDKLYIDKVDPVIKISGVEAANRDAVMPEIEISDDNYSAEDVEITLMRYLGGKREKVAYEIEEQSNSANGKGTRIVLKDIEHKKTEDDFYTLTVEAKDKAGNSSKEEAEYTVNRFGSAYRFDEYTERVLGNYVQMPADGDEDIVVIEANVDSLKSKEVQISYNGTVRTLTEGEDYEVEEDGANGQKIFTYHIFRSNFAEDGRYVINIFSEDAAGNECSNQGQGVEIEFIVDNTAPTIVVTGIDNDDTVHFRGNPYIVNGGAYNETRRTITIDARDNILLSSLTVEVYDDEGQEYRNDELSKTYTMDELEEADGLVQVELGEADSNRIINIVAVDAAGNTLGAIDYPEVLEGAPARVAYRVLVTTNPFVRWFQNRPLFYGTIAAGLALLLLIILIIRRRSKSKKEQQA